MSKKSPFWGSFHKYHGKRVESLYKAERKCLYHIYWSLSKHFRFKKSFLVICKILRLSVNSLIVDDKYFLLKRDNLWQYFQIQLSMKRKIFSHFFSFFEIYIQFWTFSKKNWSSQLIDFWTYGLRKSWLDKCLKSPVSEDPLTSNIVNRPKHCSKLNNSIFTYLVIPVKTIQVEKVSLSDTQNLRIVC